LGVLIVITWLKLVGESLALLVIKYYHYLEQYFQRYIKGKKIQLRNKVNIIKLIKMSQNYFVFLQISQQHNVPFCVPITLLVLYILGGSLLFSIWEGWSYIDGAYFSFITFTTIGFGDLVPGESTISHQSGRSILCATYLLFGVMLTAMSFRLMQEDINRFKINLFRRLDIKHVHLPVIKR
jgi:hypothetical protein